jgi:predicted transcriptional regulator
MKTHLSIKIEKEIKIALSKLSIELDTNLTKLVCEAIKDYLKKLSIL